MLGEEYIPKKPLISEIQHFLLDRNQYVQEKTVSTGLSAEEMIAKLIDDLVLLAKKHVMASKFLVEVENLQFVVLVCVPDDISPAKRQMIMTAGEIAGFTGRNLRLINESTATAINHLYDEFSIGRLNCEQQEKVHQGSSGVERSQSSSVSGFAAKGGRIKSLCVILCKESQHRMQRFEQRQFVVTFFKLKPNIPTTKTSGAAGDKLFAWQMEFIDSFSVVDTDDLERQATDLSYAQEAFDIFF